VANATGYKWGITSNYATATDLGPSLTKTETGLACNTPYTRYVWAYRTCGTSTSTVLAQSTTMNLATGITISASANPVCAGTSVTFAATPNNGGTTPAYQWRLNGSNINGATNATYTYMPAANDKITCRLTTSLLCPVGSPALSNEITMTVNPVLVASVSIGASANPVCSGTSVTFTATPTNGGTAPAYQWKVNGAPASGATNASYSYVQASNNAVTCTLTSNAVCVTGSPATSNTVTMTVNPLTSAPTAGTHTAAQTQITWNWNASANATGYKWNTTNNFGTATDMGTAITKIETGLTCNTPYTRYIWAYDACAVSLATTLTQSTSLNPPAAPASGTHVPAITQIIWNWNTVAGATGYKWNTTNSYADATDMGTATTKTETGLTCQTAYSRYIWAYNSCGVSIATELAQTTNTDPPAVPVSGAHVATQIQ
jgi:hypothetical protein